MERKVYESFLSTLTEGKRDALNELVREVPDNINAQESFLGASSVFTDHLQQYEVHFKKVMDSAQLHCTGACTFS